MNSINALPPHVEASVGPVGTPTKQSQADVLVDMLYEISGNSIKKTKDLGNKLNRHNVSKDLGNELDWL